jgi:hypothetical protein
VVVVWFRALGSWVLEVRICRLFYEMDILLS